MNRPFVYGELAQKENFIDRVEDRKRLKTFLGNGINVMLISPRRWGKSSLVKMTMEELQAEDKDVRVCFIDAFKIHSEAEFFNAYTTAFIGSLASTLEKGIEFLKKYIPAFSPSLTLKSDPLNSVSIDLNFKPLKHSAEDILDMPEKIAKSRGLHIIVCIDEFQQLANLPEWKHLEGMMRSVWQQHQEVNYCLYGSKRHMMMDIFNNANNPFYRFGQVFYLDKISEKYWIPYIVKSFSKTGRTISETFAKRICDTMECHSWYVQQLSFFIWSSTTNEVTEEIFNSQLQIVIDTNRPVFENDIDGLASSQVSMLVAVANGADHLSSKDVVMKYHLGGAQTITRNKMTLINKDILEKDDNAFHFVDPVFGLWFKREYCRIGI